ncbi:MAG TPA: thiamine-phosphate kinase [Terriglobales bacterium]
MPLHERALIARLHRSARTGRDIVTGIGDDAAVLRIPRGHEALVTTDFSLEGIHFRRDWHPPESVGHRCLARGLSDIAAMGGKPVAAFLSLALPRKLPQAWVDRFMRGLLHLADHFGVALAGGDTAESPGGILADIVVLGSVPRGKALLRSRARPGDRLYVSGALGAAAATLQKLRHSGHKLDPKQFPEHFFPIPRIALGRRLREKRLASAMIDLSDGLSTDLGHICEESGVGAEVNGAALPLARIGNPLREVDLHFALHGGEAYELLFTAPAHKPVPHTLAGVPITAIGTITRRRGVVLQRPDGTRCRLQPRGWEHFANRK